MKNNLRNYQIVNFKIVYLTICVQIIKICIFERL